MEITKIVCMYKAPFSNVAQVALCLIRLYRHVSCQINVTQDFMLKMFPFTDEHVVCTYELRILFSFILMCRYGLRSRELMNTVGKSMVQGGGTFGLFMSIGTGIRC